MARPIKKERNRLIMTLHDKGWTLERIAKEVNLRAKSTVHEIIENENRRSALKNKGI